MIKKYTKITFEDGGLKGSEELKGGMPLTEGEIIHYSDDNGEITNYIVIDKNIDYSIEGADRIVKIHYILRKTK